MVYNLYERTGLIVSHEGEAKLVNITYYEYWFASTGMGVQSVLHNRVQFTLGALGPA